MQTARPEPPTDWPLGVHHVRIATLEECRRLLGPRDAAEREARARVYFAEMPDRARTRLHLGMHDRGESFVLAEGTIQDDDLAGHARHLPLALKVVRLAERRLRADEVWDVSATHAEWPTLRPREELYTYVHVDRLVVSPGARLEVHGNVLVLEIGVLELVADEAMARTGRAPSETHRFEIRIGPTPFDSFSRFRREPARDGVSGADGADGSDARVSELVGTPFGPMAREVVEAGESRPGGDGADGTDGTVGMNGGMAMLADLRIARMEGFAPRMMRVVSQAGPGAPGGRGGDGGLGGRGATIGARNGARGGDGGHGGAGGRGGNGGLASNVFIRLPVGAEDLVDLRPLPSVGGLGGEGGKGGKGVVAGRDGPDGPPGRGRPAPRMHLYLAP